MNLGTFVRESISSFVSFLLNCMFSQGRSSRLCQQDRAKSAHNWSLATNNCMQCEGKNTRLGIKCHEGDKLISELAIVGITDCFYSR